MEIAVWLFWNLMMMLKIFVIINFDIILPEYIIHNLRVKRFKYNKKSKTSQITKFLSLLSKNFTSRQKIFDKFLSWDLRTSLFVYLSFSIFWRSSELFCRLDKRRWETKTQKLHFLVIKLHAYHKSLISWH